MDFSLSSEQQLIRKNIIEFAQKELNENLVERDKLQQFSFDLWNKCAEQKLQGLPVEPSLGGAGLDPLSCIIALEAFGYGCHDGGLSFAICAHLLAGVIPIWKYGTENQRKKFIPELCNGKKIAVNAMTETESGSDAFSIKTKAEKQGNDYIINGVKTFSSNGPDGNTILVYAVTDEKKGYHGGITAFIIDRNTPGLKTGQQFEKMGLRTCKISELIFENVLVPEENVLGGIGGGTTVFNYSMEWERTGMAACHVGIIERLLEKSVDYARSRKTGNEMIGKKQAVSHRIATIKTQLEGARLLTYKAASGLNKNRENAIYASIAKLFVSEAYTSAAMETIQIFGGNGYMTAYEIERVFRDSVGSIIHSGTSDIQRNIISGLLGL